MPVKAVQSTDLLGNSSRTDTEKAGDFLAEEFRKG
jgi:hypothetical protein